MRGRFLWIGVALVCVLALGGALTAQAAAPPEPVGVVAPVPAESTPCAAGEAAAASVRTFYITLRANADTFVYSGMANTNYGDLTYMHIGRPTFTSYDDGLVYFNLGPLLSAMPANAVVVSATLQLSSTQTSVGLRAYTAQSAWGEMTVTYNTMPGRSTDSVAAFYRGVGWQKWDVTTFVQNWATGAATNYGFILSQAGTTAGVTEFKSREGNFRYAPQLVIAYATSGSPMWFSAQRDAWIDQGAPSTNHGGDGTLFVSGSAPEKRALVWFDVTDLLTDVRVLSATLQMHTTINRAQREPAQPTAIIYANPILNSWEEMAVTWNSAVTYTTGVSTNYTYAQGWTSWDVTPIVQQWVSGTLENNGIILRGGPAEFDAGKDTDGPRLIVTYTTCIRPLTGVGVSGPLLGVTGITYTFSAAPIPADATEPINYRWSATNHICGVRPLPPCPTGPQVEYSWATTGTKTITLRGSNCGGGYFYTTHVITVTEPPPGCDVLTGVSLAGPTTGVTNTQYTFTATVTPPTATLPVTYTWEATGLPPVVVVTDALTLTQSFAWPDAGAKAVTVTVRNCGGAANAVQQVGIAPLASLPDLIISGGWYELEGDRVGYVMRNVGGSTAYAGPGIVIDILNGGSMVSQGLISQDIPAGAIRSGYINYTWHCVGMTNTVALVADSWDGVLEGDEANNAWESVWECDMRLPRIISGPTVDQVTEHTARVRWTTSEPTHDVVRYGSNSGAYSRSAEEPAGFYTHHEIVLNDLYPGVVYHYMILMTDQAGHQANSADKFFASAPPCSDPPVITPTLAFYPSPTYEFYILQAAAAEAQCVDHVTFSFMGTVIGTDYTPDPATGLYEVYLSPHAQGWTRGQFSGAPRALKVEAKSMAGTLAESTVQVTPITRPTPMQLDLVNPDPDETVYVPGDAAPAGTGLQVGMYAYKFEWACTWSGAAEGGVVPPGLSAVKCGDVDAPVYQASIFFDGVSKKTFAPPGSSEIGWKIDIGGAALGDHVVRVCAQPVSGAAQTCAEQTIHIVQGEPTVTMQRKITRIGNYFQVELGLRNVGVLPAQLFVLRDDLWGFMAADKSFKSSYRVEMFYYRPWEKHGVVRFFFADADGNYVPLNPGGVYTVTYLAVPVLYETWDASLYAISPYGTHLNYYVQGDEGQSDQRFGGGATSVYDAAAGGNVSFSQAVADALKQSNYVIVTNPQRLIDHYTYQETYPLLMEMAHLATLKNAALGFLDTYDGSVLDNLLDPRKNYPWESVLSPDFGVKNKSYVLIVGETEIVPSWYVGSGHFTTYPGIPDHVHESDLWYADTAGNTSRPEHMLGRLIGDCACTLKQGLLSSIQVAEGGYGYNFDRSAALLVSGRGEGVTSNFIPTVDIIAGVLADQGIVVNKYHTYYHDPADIRPFFLNQDIVFYRDHGNTDVWGDHLQTSDVSSLNFGNARPFAFAAACLAGNYEGDNDSNIAEAFMARGAAVYIGSTEISERSTNDYASKWFYRNWPFNYSIGHALNNAKIAAWDDDGAVYDNGKLWAFEYQLYGDPSYGIVSTARAAAPLAATEVITTLHVHIPDFVVETVDGYDYVEIPDGGLRSEPGGYRTPYWSLALDYPAGFRAQSVSLTLLYTPVVTTGFHLITVTPGVDCQGCPPLTSPALLETEGWVPDMAKKFEWTVESGGDGGSTLLLKVYPFFYNPQTSDVVFYRDFDFAIEVITTSAEIDYLYTDANVYHPGDVVTLDLGVRNAGAARDLIVDAAVRIPDAGDVITGLPLRILPALTGTASIALEWETAGFPADEYAIVVRLMDTEGHELDSEATRFTLGATSAEVTALTATPQLFAPGDDIAISLIVSNTGDLPIYGTAVVQVQHTTGLTVVREFTHALAGLTPGASIALPDVWDSAGATARSYRILGYVKYNSQTSNARSVVVENKPVLTIAKTAAPDPVQAGGLLTYTIVVGNEGTADATGVVITDTPPLSTTFLRASAGGALTGGEVRWTGQTVATGDALTVTFTVTVSAALAEGTVITNAAYGVRCAESPTATLGAPVTTAVQAASGQYHIYLPLVLRNR